MVLDAYNTIYLWVGLKANDTEKRNSLKKVEKYVANLTDGRAPESIQYCNIDPGSEPLGFRGFFPEWEDAITDEWFQLDPYEAKLAAIEATRKAT
jgi:gelsolin